MLPGEAREVVLALRSTAKRGRQAGLASRGGSRKHLQRKRSSVRGRCGGAAGAAAAKQGPAAFGGHSPDVADVHVQGGAVADVHFALSFGTQELHGS